MENSKDPIFGNTSSRGLIGWIKSVCGSSLQSWNLLTEISGNKCFLSTFGRKKIDLTATTWHHVYFWKKNRLIKQHDVYQIGLAKVFSRRMQKKIRNFLWNIPGKSSKHRHLTCQIAFFRNHLVPILSDFWNPKFLCSDWLDCKLIFQLSKSWIKNM